jgi:O-antigen/teichoic acid export membrane protein
LENLSIKKLLVKNTGFQMFAQAVSLLLSLATTYILSRHLGVERFGGINFIFAFYYFFQVLNEFGIDTAVIREGAQDPARFQKILATMRAFKMIVAAVSMALALGVIHLMNYPAALRIPLLIYSLILPLIALQLPNLVFNVRLNMKIPAMLGICKVVCIFVLLIALVAGGWGMTGYVVALILSEAIVAFLVNFYAQRSGRIGWGIDWKICSLILRTGFPIVITGIFVAVINRSDFIMLEKMTDLRQVGLYASLYKITSLLESLPLMAMTTLFPLLSRYAKEDGRRFWEIYKKATFLLASLAVPMVLVISFAAPWVIRLLFGDAFLDAAAGLRVQIWATAFLYLAITGGNALISLGLEKINLTLTAIAAAINVALNLYCIPRWGFIGASLATAAAYFFLFAGNTLTMAVVGRKKLPLKSARPEFQNPGT